ncbi:DegT/DnrJ/EryC1/StrS aminotransferase family protein [Rhodospirillales bacterium]|nr:DegT/DnrJ/EryC1/StrS aminotransferase family protein [Rhodospirillales bacterium]
MTKQFEKPFTQQEPISEDAIERVGEILRSGRLHRYNTIAGEVSEASLLEKEFAAWQGTKYCLATTSGGQAMQIALRTAGVKPGTKVLANAYTLAPVPGAIYATGGEPVLVEIDENWHTDIDDLRAKAKNTGAKYFILSHMRGHIVDMDAIKAVCDEFGIILIEDCAHTMGAKWKGTRSGNFGDISCFSTQTYKHINSGEGGFLITDNPEFAARAVVGSGSYMLYGSHGAIPPEDVFQKVRLDSPNCSARLDNLRAAILRDQLPNLEANVHRWNVRYHILEAGFRTSLGLSVIERKQHEEFVGSSIQFKATGIAPKDIPAFLKDCGSRGVEIKWFGGDEPVAFTSRYDSWQYLGDMDPLPNTIETLSTTCDLRIPLTFSEQDCQDIVDIVSEEMAARLNT